MTARGLGLGRVWLVVILLLAAWRLDAQDDPAFDLIVRGDRIARIGDLSGASAPRVISAEGLVVRRDSSIYTRTHDGESPASRQRTTRCCRVSRR